jgi:hypothetical protein
MTRRFTFYGFVAAAVATAVSGLVYSAARSRLAAFRDIGEGSAQEIGSVQATTDLCFQILVVTGILTVILFLWFIALRRRDESTVA